MEGRIDAFVRMGTVRVFNIIFNSHFEGPAEFLLRRPGRNQVVRHDELFEVQVPVPVRVQGPQHRQTYQGPLHMFLEAVPDCLP